MPTFPMDYLDKLSTTSRAKHDPRASVPAPYMNCNRLILHASALCLWGFSLPAKTGFGIKRCLVFFPTALRSTVCVRLQWCISHMIGFLSIVAIGFFLGMRHATDPDHVIAVTTIVSRESKLGRAALTGIAWGIGHTITILLVGTGIILFGLVIPTRLGLSMEFSVALMLVALGLMNVIAFIRSTRSMTERGAPLHAHPHSHGDYGHKHGHGHGPHPHPSDATPLSRIDRRFARIGIYRQVRPLLVGIVHGLAGSAAVALLVLTTIRDPRWAIAYLLVFGLGTVAGMMLITMSIASAFNFLGRRHASFSARLGFVSGLLSLAFGLLLVYQIGYASGLFSGHPQWTPR